MCVIAGGELQPSNTTLTSMPVTIDGILSQLLVYTNSMKPKSKLEEKINYYSFDSFYTPRSNSDSNSDSVSTSGIMLVGIPSHTNIHLYDNKELKEFNSDTESLSKKIIQYDDFLLSTHTNSSSRSYEDASMSVVRQVGNYKISIVKDLDTFENSIDWTQFSKPDDFKEKISVFKDKKLFPDTYKWSYLVAEAMLPVVDDGFGISFPMVNDTIYYPTCHELSKIYHYDVTINLYSQKEFSKIPFSLYNNVQFDKQSRKIYSHDKNHLRAFSGNASMSYIINGINYNTGIPMILNINTNNVNLSSTSINCNAPNQNIFL